MFLHDFACESFILAYRFNGLDGFLVVNKWQQLANNYFIALLREEGNDVSICQKRSKMGQKNYFPFALSREAVDELKKWAHMDVRAETL